MDLKHTDAVKAEKDSEILSIASIFIHVITGTKNLKGISIRREPTSNPPLWLKVQTATY